MDAIVHHPEGCCCTQLMEEIKQIRELRAELEGFVRAVSLAKSIVSGSRPQPAPAPRRTAQLVPFPARVAAS